MKELFMLQPDMVFLNHGSFGACPRPVFQAYQEWQRTMEAQPVEFLSRQAEELLQLARSQLADYVGTTADNLVFVTNATTGVNIVARSLKLEPGDEILATNHEYGAIDRTWRFLCGKNGARYVHQPMLLNVTTPAEFVEQFWEAVTPRTRIISLSHITSPTALIFPLAEICRRARQAGILTIIDGAHAPGQLLLDLPNLGADFYSGNCHKWLCAPKGAAFLYARPEVQELIEPFVVSWGYESLKPSGSRFVDWLEWQGSKDFSAYLAVPAAINFQAKYHWGEVRASCQRMLTTTRQRIEALTGLPPVYPEAAIEYEWYKQMAVMRLPKCDPLRLKNRLWDEFKIEVPIIVWNDETLLRVSVQGYNTQSDLDWLVQALEKLLPQEARLK